MLIKRLFSLTVLACCLLGHQSLFCGETTVIENKRLTISDYPNASVKHVILKNTKYPAKTLIKLLTFCRHLTTLTLADDANITNPEGLVLNKNDLRPTYFDSITDLVVSSQKITTATLLKLLPRLRKLKRLDLTGSTISPDDQLTITQACPQGIILTKNDGNIQVVPQSQKPAPGNKNPITINYKKKKTPPPSAKTPETKQAPAPERQQPPVVVAQQPNQPTIPLEEGSEMHFTFEYGYLQLASCAGNEDLKMALSKNPKALDMSFNTRIKFDDKTFEWASSPQLIELHLDSTNITAVVLKKILSACPNLKYLNLPYCTKINFDDEALDWTQCPQLTSLDLEYTKITVAKLKKILSACPDLKYLNLLHCKNLDKQDQNMFYKDAIEQLRKQLAIEEPVSENIPELKATIKPSPTNQENQIANQPVTEKPNFQNVIFEAGKPRVCWYKNPWVWAGIGAAGLAAAWGVYTYLHKKPFMPAVFTRTILQLKRRLAPRFSAALTHSRQPNGLLRVSGES
ncbi:MAG: F-box/LRR-repeat protein [candidate division TM6 bacterium GW2011_GWE2_42_60]|nr:MAG: F-box/LRR-repeat protein [candidate division TM6 bacterium GW2011_GWE2_42_60]HBY05375.1 hypothetical protein [Candidatus Dependentiae bacterium]